jgi:uncharacterized protein (TIGR02246 family)
MVVGVLAFVLVALTVFPAAAQSDFVVKAACIGGYANSVTEVAAAIDGTIRWRRYFQTARVPQPWGILDRNPEQVKAWVNAVDATPMRRVRVPVSQDRNPCKEGSSRPCHIVRRKGKTNYFVCRAQAVLKEMMDFSSGRREQKAVEAAVSVVEKWFTGAAAADVAVLAELYADDASFISPHLKEMLRGRDDIAAHLHEALVTNRQRVSLNVQENKALSDTVVLITGQWEWAGEAKGERAPEVGEFSFIIAQRDERWLIVHFHHSAVAR